MTAVRSVALLLATVALAAGCRSVEARPAHLTEDAARQLHVICAATGADGGEPAAGRTTYACPHGEVVLGCTPGAAQPSWAIGPTTGRTADVAVDRLLEQLGPEYAAHPMPTGYPGAATQTWLALADGTPALTIQVTRRRSGYTAGPDKLCNG